MNLFNKKIEKAVNKAKERIASEYNVTLEQIDKIIEEDGSEIDDKIEQSIESVSESVAAALNNRDVIAATLVNAIEEATGEAIEQSLEEN